MNAFQKAVSGKRFCCYRGVLSTQLVNSLISTSITVEAVYKSYGFTEQNLDEDGNHDPMFDDKVDVCWDGSNSSVSVTHEDFDCDWGK